MDNRLIFFVAPSLVKIILLEGEVVFFCGHNHPAGRSVHDHIFLETASLAPLFATSKPRAVTLRSLIKQEDGYPAIPALGYPLRAPIGPGRPPEDPQRKFKILARVRLST